MAYNQTPAFVLVALVLFTAANPTARGQLIPFNGIVTNGILCCTSTGNCPSSSGQPLSGTLVSLNCTNFLGVTSTVAQAVTNATGSFNFNVTNILNNTVGSILNSPILPTCTVSVNLPLNQTICPVLSTLNGTLTAITSSVAPVLTGVLGAIGNLTFSPFVRIGV